MKRLVIDTETTGFSPRINKTLTVGLLLIDVEKDFLDILDSSHTFIKHDRYNHTAGASSVHKIDMDVHEKIAVEPKDACLEINDFVEGNSLHETTLVGHNISFDRGFLNSLFDQGECLHKFHHEQEDTMHLWNGFKRKGVVPSVLRSNLGTLAEHFEVDYTKAHDALADCHITAKVYWKLLGLKG